jgi:ribonuclease HII
MILATLSLSHKTLSRHLSLEVPHEFGFSSHLNSLHSNNTIVGGVDEAGRGSVMGPLVVAGVSVEKRNLSRLRRAGVRDSKLLSPKARCQLFSQIVDLAEHICILKSDCNEVDHYVFSNMLNKLEAEAMAAVIDSIYAARVYVDACDVNSIRYKECVECHLAVGPKPRIFSLHHCDRTSTVVSAASIIAKVVRDGEIQRIRLLHKEIGSGYPCDKKTMGFIAQWISNHHSAPPFVRKSWQPVRAIIENHRRDVPLGEVVRESLTCCY